MKIYQKYDEVDIEQGEDTWQNNMEYLQYHHSLLNVIIWYAFKNIEVK